MIKIDENMVNKIEDELDNYWTVNSCTCGLLLVMIG
jgi:hypothetical protein